MKVLKKPKFRKIACAVCGCVFQPESSDILAGTDGPFKEGKVFARCPVCLAACEARPSKRRGVWSVEDVAAPVLVKGDPENYKDVRCGTCKYTDFSFEDEPCCDCNGGSKWEAAE